MTLPIPRRNHTPMTRLLTLAAIMLTVLLAIAGTAQARPAPEVTADHAICETLDATIASIEAPRLRACVKAAIPDGVASSCPPERILSQSGVAFCPAAQVAVSAPILDRGLTGRPGQIDPPPPR